MAIRSNISIKASPQYINATVIDAITIPIAFSKWLIIISSELFSLIRLPLRCFEPLSAPSPMLKACCYVPGYPKVWLHRFYQANHSIILLTIPRKAQPQYIITVPIIITINTKKFFKCSIIVSSKLFSLFRLPLRCFEPLSAPSPMLKACCYVPGYPKVWLHRFYQANHSIILPTIPITAQPKYVSTVPIVIIISQNACSNGFIFNGFIFVSSKLFFYVPRN